MLNGGDDWLRWCVRVRNQQKHHQISFGLEALVSCVIGLTSEGNKNYYCKRGQRSLTSAPPVAIWRKRVEKVLLLLAVSAVLSLRTHKVLTCLHTRGRPGWGEGIEMTIVYVRMVVLPIAYVIVNRHFAKWLSYIA